MKKSQILAALLVLALLSGVAALHFKGGSEKGTAMENQPSSRGDSQNLDSTEVEEPKSHSCALWTNTSFEPVNAGGGWSVSGTDGTKFNEALELVPEVDYNEMKSYGKALIKDWPREMGIKPPCILAGESVVFISNRTAKARFSFTVSKKFVIARRGDFPAGEVYLADYVIPIRNTSWIVDENVLTVNESDFLKTGGMIPRKTRLTAACSCTQGELTKAIEDSIFKAGFEQAEVWWEPSENEYFKPVMARLYKKDGQYLYVEVSEVKGTGLLRVFMTMGNEGLAKAAGGMFSATTLKEPLAVHELHD